MLKNIFPTPAPHCGEKVGRAPKLRDLRGFLLLAIPRSQYEKTSDESLHQLVKRAGEVDRGRVAPHVGCVRANRRAVDVGTRSGTGMRWRNQIAEHLAVAKIALVRVTAQNKLEPWLHFEAGAISNALGENFVLPILFDTPADSGPGTLAQFQLTQFTSASFFSLIRTLNKLRDKPESAHDLRERFDRLWVGFEPEVRSILENAEVAAAQKNALNAAAPANAAPARLAEGLDPDALAILKAITGFNRASGQFS
jgi:hypothetical protein